MIMVNEARRTASEADFSSLDRGSEGGYLAYSISGDKPFVPYDCVGCQSARGSRIWRENGYFGFTIVIGA